jgi:hypothetical protein
MHRVGFHEKKRQFAVPKSNSLPLAGLVFGLDMGIYHALRTAEQIPTGFRLPDDG